jgi:hypothetical protein
MAGVEGGGGRVREGKVRGKAGVGKEEWEM